MKSPKYLFISLIMLAVTNNLYACWGPWYEPKGYYMYRVHNNKQEPTLNVESQHSGEGLNCLEWQKATSETIPLEEIYQVVYKMSLKEFEDIYNNRGAKYDNKFVEWITKKDSAILDFLLLAKTNEYIRLKRSSRWYYPSMKTGARMTLEEIAEKAISQKDGKLRDRYLLQGIRALFSLTKYEECIELWENEISRLPEDNLMRQLIQPYIAGAEYHIKRPEKAIEYFAQLGDLESMRFCAGCSGGKISTIDALEIVCKYAPNSKFIEETLQTYIRSIEPIGEFYWEDKLEKTPEIDRLRSLSLKMARGGGSDNPAMWYYTAAFLEDLFGNASGASRLLGLAEKSKSTEYLAESIKIFRIYLDAKLLPYNSHYENRLFSQLKWLDLKIQSDLNDEVCNETARGFKLFNCESYYYWNDMMRRIVLAEVCPRMIKAGKTSRALQLANMADNRMRNLVNGYDICDWSTDKITHSYTKPHKPRFRYSIKFNSCDYRNHFFEMIDSIGIDNVIKYVGRVNKPQSDFDRFLNSRGYVESDYLNDIIGTQCLRNMQYKKALNYLGKVSETYKTHQYMEYDPFSIVRKPIKMKTEFKYEFAREMYSLEQSIDLTSEPNRRAMLMVKYATGIRNSFDWCWGLTQYYRGSNYWGQVCEKRDWENDDNTKAAIRKANELIELACDIVTDDEIAANIQYMLCNFKTVALNYPNTEKGRLVRGKCDNLYDHHANL